MSIPSAENQSLNSAVPSTERSNTTNNHANETGKVRKPYHLVTASADKIIMLWNAATGEHIQDVAETV
eukprot:159133-Hanusia_phi.AAC.3